MTVLRGMSFHSVKGGVGKSTLATVAAFQHAMRRPDDSVVLIDMDLTGTSLAEALCLCAPRWSQSTVVTREVLEAQSPDGFCDREETLRRIQERDESQANDATQRDYRVPFLNDFLLHTPTDRRNPRDVRVDSLLWQMSAKHSNFRVLPSSSIPWDLELIAPVIFDEQHSGFLEARLEALLALLLEWHQTSSRTGDIVVVIDAPSSFVGLSRSVMSIGLRLTSSEKQELSDDGGMPSSLKNSEVKWRIFTITTADQQDLHAAVRWFLLAGDDERRVFRVVINRVHRTIALLAPGEITGPEASPIMDLIVVPEAIDGFFACDNEALQITAMANFQSSIGAP